MKRLIFLLVSLIAIKGFAQQTGQFDTTINFMGSQRALTIYVPPGYNSSNQYHLMILLHGLGQPANSYASVLLATNGGWSLASYFPNTIFIFPEVYDLNSDFYNPAGGEQIIQTCIDLAKSNYNIDTTNIILQGLSIGGRDALRYGLDHYTQFKGLLLNTPAAQGVKEALNLSATFPFSYQNAPHIPIYMTHGTLDTEYQNINDTIYNQLVLNNGLVRFFEFPIGHTIPSFSQMLNMLPFFDTVTSPGPDIDLVSINVPTRSCNVQIPATCLVRNVGRDTVQSASLSYTLNGSTQYYTWNGSLSPFQHALVSLPTLTAVAGNQTLDVKIDTLNTTIKDTIVYTNEKNERAVPFQIVSNGEALPFFEGFEGSVFPPANWIAISDGDPYPGKYGWFANAGISASGNNSMLCYNNLFEFENAGRTQQMLTPVLDLTSTPNPHLNFDVAYFYIEYSAGVEANGVPIGGDYTDTLDVSISTDCGNTYNSIFKKGGTQLSTFMAPDINPTTENAALTFPSALNYAPVSLDLSDYAIYDKAVVKFSYISDQGGVISLDNIGVADSSLSVKEITLNNGLKVYPNPATDYVNIATESSDPIIQVNVTNVLGNKIVTINNQKQDNTLSINTASFAKGVYFFEVVMQRGIDTKKVIICDR